LTGNISLYAPSITINSANSTFTPYYHGLTAYQTGTNDMQINSSGLTIGTVFAPNAAIHLTGGSGGTITGCFEGLNVSVSGSNWTFVGNGPSYQSSGEALIQ
jgi:hypothetical protein